MNGNTDAVIEYNARMLQGLKKLTKSNIEEIKFLLDGSVGEGILENINSALDLFRMLQKLNWISIGNNEYLYKLLRSINRPDIVPVMKGESSEIATPPSIRSNSHDIPCDVFDRKVLQAVAKEICKHWKFLSRELELAEKDIEMIDIDNRLVYEKSIKSLQKWKETYPNDFHWDTLKSALSRVPRQDIIRHIEKEFPMIVSREARPTSENNLQTLRPTRSSCVEESSPNGSNTATILSVGVSTLHMEDLKRVADCGSYTKESSENAENVNNIAVQVLTQGPPVTDDAPSNSHEKDKVDD